MSLLDELLSLPDVPVVRFRHPPLVLAICQVRFNPVLEVANPGFVAAFQRALQDDFPVASAGQGLELQVGPGFGEPRFESRPQQSSHYEFASRDGAWTVVLTESFVSLETRAYKDFVDFLTRFRGILSALVQHVQPTLVTRMGLRYINEIRIGELTYEMAVRPELLGPLAVPELASNTAQSFQHLNLQYAGDQGISITHGYFRGGTSVRPRAGQDPSDQPFYLLDFDIFREFPLEAGSVTVDPALLTQHLERYNKVIYRLFRWAITEPYADTLGIE